MFTLPDAPFVVKTKAIILFTMVRTKGTSCGGTAASHGASVVIVARYGGVGTTVNGIAGVVGTLVMIVAVHPLMGQQLS